MLFLVYYLSQEATGIVYSSRKYPNTHQKTPNFWAHSGNRPKFLLFCFVLLCVCVCVGGGGCIFSVFLCSNWLLKLGISYISIYQTSELYHFLRTLIGYSNLGYPLGMYWFANQNGIVHMRNYLPAEF